MGYELLTPQQMGEADALTIAAGSFDGMALMRRAGAAVAAAALRRHAGTAPIHVLAGPGNNGGDGYVAARLLDEAGVDVRLWRSDSPRKATDAWVAAEECPLNQGDLADFHVGRGALVIDALFGAGLLRPLRGVFAAAVQRTRESAAAVLSVDLPSGISGLDGSVLGTAFEADHTVTFFRKKPGHLLFPGRAHCGEVIVEDIGIPASVLGAIGPRFVENTPELWIDIFPRPARDAHKYSRGHVAVFSGGLASTGASRLSAIAAARAGAGAVTLLSPSEALGVNAAHLTSTILRERGSIDEVISFLRQRQPDALVFGPGAGTGKDIGDFALRLMSAAAGLCGHIVFDADAITLFSERREDFLALAASGAPALLLTPHEGEFRRLFPDLAVGRSKLDRALAAALATNATIILKGPDTVIASPGGRAAINANGTPLLATAGSGDVLAGIAAGLLAQGMPVFEAAAAAVFLHAEAAARFGPGLIAEDLPAALPPVLAALHGEIGVFEAHAVRRKRVRPSP